MRLACRLGVVFVIATIATSIALGAKAATKAPPLSEWAPKHPSLEFLRAAKILKPLPPELVEQFSGGDVGERAKLYHYQKTIPLLYELFGTLIDRQMVRLKSTKEIRIPARLVTPQQRDLLARWFRVWRDNMKSASPDFRDVELILYKFGARRDLSNADMGFQLQTRHLVVLKFWIKQESGRIYPLTCAGFACI